MQYHNTIIPALLVSHNMYIHVLVHTVLLLFASGTECCVHVWKFQVRRSKGWALWERRWRWNKKRISCFRASCWSWALTTRPSCPETNRYSLFYDTACVNTYDLYSCVQRVLNGVTSIFDSSMLSVSWTPYCWEDLLHNIVGNFLVAWWKWNSSWAANRPERCQFPTHPWGMYMYSETMH